jgi:hypothetical protein
MAGGLALVAVGAAGGYTAAVVTVHDAEGMTDAEHDRLVDACVADYDTATIDCVAWVSDAVAAADRNGQTYEDVARTMADQLAADQQAQAERDAAADAANLEATTRSVCDMAENLSPDTPPSDVCAALDAAP